MRRCGKHRTSKFFWGHRFCCVLLLRTKPISAERNEESLSLDKLQHKLRWEQVRQNTNAWGRQGFLLLQYEGRNA